MRAVNLIPVEQRGGSGPAAGRSEGGAYAVLVLLAGMAGLALLYGSARHEISSRRDKAASLAAQTQQAQAMVAQLAPYTSFLAMREQRVKAVSELAQSRFDWAYAFHELGRVLPKDASISSLNGSVGSAGGGSSSSSSSASAASAASGGTVTSATPPGSVPTFTVSGCATSQAEVAQTLNRLRLMNGVSDVTLQSSAKASGSGGSNGSGGCVGDGPAFSATITFDPLPPVSTTSVATTRAASNGAAG
jgi:Tfp pilus assembly protein PilN